MQPTTGRIVLYRLHGGGGEVPAIVQAVGTGPQVDLRLFMPDGGFLPYVVDAKQGTEPGQWRWPPRD